MALFLGAARSLDLGDTPPTVPPLAPPPKLLAFFRFNPSCFRGDFRTNGGTFSLPSSGSDERARNGDGIRKQQQQHFVLAWLATFE